MVYLLAERDHFGGEDLKRVGNHPNVDLGIGHDRLAVEVHNPFMLAVDGQRFCFERADFAVLVDGSREELDAK